MGLEADYKWSALDGHDFVRPLEDQKPLSKHHYCLPAHKLAFTFQTHSGLIYYEYVDGQNCCLNGVVYLRGKERLMTCSVSVTGHPSKHHHGCLCFWSTRLVCLLNGKLISIGMYQQKCFSPSHCSSVCGTDSWMDMLLEGLVSVRLFICIFGKREIITFNQQGCKGGMYHGFQLNNNNTKCPFRTKSTN